VVLRVGPLAVLFLGHCVLPFKRRILA
jgi:hypothetical protein